MEEEKVWSVDLEEALQEGTQVFDEKHDRYLESKLAGVFLHLKHGHGYDDKHVMTDFEAVMLQRYFTNHILKRFGDDGISTAELMQCSNEFLTQMF
jgi:hypothetical protein